MNPSWVTQPAKPSFFSFFFTAVVCNKNASQRLKAYGSVEAQSRGEGSQLWLIFFNIFFFFMQFSKLRLHESRAFFFFNSKMSECLLHTWSDYTNINIEMFLVFYCVFFLLSCRWNVDTYLRLSRQSYMLHKTLQHWPTMAAHLM